MVTFLTNSVIKKWPEDLANISGPNCWSTPDWIFNFKIIFKWYLFVLEENSVLEQNFSSFHNFEYTLWWKDEAPTLFETCQLWGKRFIFLCGWHVDHQHQEAKMTYNHYICVLSNWGHSEKLLKTRWYKYPLSPNLALEKCQLQRAISQLQIMIKTQFFHFLF